ncbi:MAG: HlyD family secretion protein [Deltaproteobacteria bacterium]|nr:HlyD family secretion protein [Deltaproteobacteria bacterium]
MRTQEVSPRVRVIRATVTIVAVLVAVALVLWWWEEQRINPTTDDAFIEANIVGIAAQVSGPIVRTSVVDNQEVRRGDLLFEIDPRPFELAVSERRAERDLAAQDVEAYAAQVEVARADVATREAALFYATQYLERLQPLVEKSFVTRNALEDAATKVREASSALQSAVRTLEAAQATYGQAGDANSRLRFAQAALDEAELRLSYTRVQATVNGYVTNLNLPVGTYVNEGVRLFALVDRDSFWFSARLKETFLDRVRPGQPATITLNSYPDRPFRGIVQGVGWGIYQPDGATVGLLPEVDPVVYWVRLAQRFPVRIDFLERDPARPLRVGGNGWVTIHTGDVDVDSAFGPALVPSGTAEVDGLDTPVPEAPGFGSGVEE